MGQGRLGVSVVASAIVAVVGLVLGLTKAGTDLATFGWVLAVVGAVSLVANLALRTRLR
jgi:hypothetical protein